MNLADLVHESSRRTRLVALSGALLLILCFGFALAPGTVANPFWRNVPFALASGCFGMTGMVLAVLIPQGVRSRRYAMLLASGILAYAVGDIVWLTYEVGLRIQAPYPGLPDVFYGPLMYVPLTLALWGVVADMRQLDHAKEPVVIATLLAVLAFVLAWFTFLAPVLADRGVPLFERVVSAAYPFADVFLLFMPSVALVVVLFRLGGESLAHPWFPVTVGTVLFAVADTLYAFFQAHGEYRTGMWLDVLWLVGVASLVMGIARMADLHSVVATE